MLLLRLTIWSFIILWIYALVKRRLSYVSEISTNVFNVRDGDTFPVTNVEKGITNNIRRSKMENHDANLKKKRMEKAVPKISDALSGKNESMCIFTSPRSGNSQDINTIDSNFGLKNDELENRFAKEKLLVFVTPHSHLDPGWIFTLEQYFKKQAKDIITNIVEALNENQERKFIFAEMSYLSMWWDQASQKLKDMAKSIIANGQLEIVTGGWVMNDEANTYYFNMLDQLVEGNQWLKNNIGVQPKYGWAIDPFGYSPTMAYLLKNMDFDAMVIQRLHYDVKGKLKRNKALEFMWKQNWDRQNSTDILTHVMPYGHYDVLNSCGPDDAVCCQFDFRRIKDFSCPGKMPVPITNLNVKEKAEMIVEQYKLKSSLYRSKIIFAPLGDDFRYDKPYEAPLQFENYEKLIKYINKTLSLNVEVKFGTLNDYFTAMFKRQGVQPGEQPPGFPTLGSDFFPYADKPGGYWTGYFTTRPFTKHLDRELMGYLRAAEILYAITQTYSAHEESVYIDLIKARRNLALHQHHDGITGTSKNKVVIDFQNRMLSAIRTSIKIMENSITFLMNKNTSSKEDTLITYEKARKGSKSIKRIFNVNNDSSIIVVYNPLAQERVQVVSIIISQPFVKVKDSNGNYIAHQVILKSSDGSFNRYQYELSFTANVTAVGLTRFQIVRDNETDHSPLASVESYNNNDTEKVKHFNMEKKQLEKFVVQNDYLKATFDSEDGLLSALAVKSEKLRKMKMNFVEYGGGRGGAYIFQPYGEAKVIKFTKYPKIVNRGNLFTEVNVWHKYGYISIRIYHVNIPEARALDIQNSVDIRHSTNIELAMRIESDVVNSNSEFFTDLNGFQMQRRRTTNDDYIPSNFYPVSSLMFLEDENSRLSLQTQQANGGASLKRGWLEVVLDRKLMNDDLHGLGQGIYDNKITPSNFRLLLENFIEKNKQLDNQSAIAYPSSLSITLSQQLQHPLYVFAVESNNPDSISEKYSGLGTALPCDLHLLNLKVLQDGAADKPSDTSAMFLHRMGYDCRFETVCNNAKVTFQDIFDTPSVKDVTQSSLNLYKTRKELTATSEVVVNPMEINCYKLKLKN